MVFSFHVFRKSAPNGKLSVYVGRRDFTDHLTHVDPIDGVVMLDPGYVKSRRVFVQAVLTYRYGREEDEVMGLTFAKELVATSAQVYPTVVTPKLTSLQERLVKKLGDNAYPFHLHLPQDAPCSITLQQGPDDQGRACGVQWELRAFVGDTDEDTPHRRSCVKLAIRRLQYAQAKQGRQPTAMCTKEFLLSPGKLHLQVTLDRQKGREPCGEIYYHGEPVIVTVSVTNHSNKQVKRIKVSVVQLVDISLGPEGQIKHTIANIDTQVGCPVVPGTTLDRDFNVTPDISTLRDRRNIALDGQLKLEDTNLASSTLFTSPSQRDVFGVVVAYVVRVKLTFGTLAGDLQTEVPFTLMNAPPEEEEFPGAHPKRGEIVDENTRLIIEECTRMTLEEEERDRSKSPEPRSKKDSSNPGSSKISHPLETTENVPDVNKLNKDTQQKLKTNPLESIEKVPDLNKPQKDTPQKLMTSIEKVPEFDKPNKDTLGQLKTEEPRKNSLEGIEKVHEINKSAKDTPRQLKSNEPMTIKTETTNQEMNEAKKNVRSAKT